MAPTDARMDTPPKPRILIVEDDEDQRQLLCEALGIYYGDEQQQRIVGVPSAFAALEQPLADFDVVLLDYHLPDMSSLDLMSKIHAQVDVPVIYVTGENNSKAAADAVTRGAMDYVVKLGDYLFAIPVVVDKNLRLHGIKRENDRLRNELELMVGQLRVKNIQLKEALEQQRKMAVTDHITGLANRRHFSELLANCYDEASRYGFDLACCMCDLDHYKSINDTLGHQVGDEVLSIAAEVIRASLRSSDVASRYGGDEFVLLLPHTSVERGAAVAERILRQLALETTNHRVLNTPVSMSIGIASIAADHPPTAEAMLLMADRALYAAKAKQDEHIILHSRMALPRAAKA